VNFPVKVVIKSSKLIPTMMLGILILRRTYSAMEYAAAVMLCAGVASFTLVDSKAHPSAHARQLPPASARWPTEPALDRSN
jgi:adenosine 3'-phospho 5'-phosphosulfate transporter B3